VRQVIDLHLIDNAREAGFMRKRCLLLLIILIAACLLIYIVDKVQNIFDEMYYALSETSIIPPTLADYSDLSYVDAINRKIIDEFGRFRIYYDQSFDSYAQIRLIGDINEKKISIYVRIDFEDYEITNGRLGYCIWLVYEYDVNKKTLSGLPLEVVQAEYTHRTDSIVMAREDARSFLTEHGIDIEMIEEWNQYYLYDKVLADWFRYNGWRSRFSINNLGNVKIVWDQW
jgi:hypothetical protein